MIERTVVIGDCVEVMMGMPPCSVDAIVTDPPYGLKFMGTEWDNLGAEDEMAAWHERWARGALRVLKPGGHALVFSGSRTYHHAASGLEAAGLEIRDQVMWVYGTGFPKGIDVGKAIDQAAGVEREVISARPGHKLLSGIVAAGREGATRTQVLITAAATEDAKRWDGWRTQLKPAHEPLVLCRKPLEGTVIENVLKWGTGALNILGCRTRSEGGSASLATTPRPRGGDPDGRWPANFSHDGGEEVEECLGRASSFFKVIYCPKPSKAEKDAGIGDATPEVKLHRMSFHDAKGRNNHPTVKPVALMAYLCRLVTPPGGVVLDPFCGSGTTGVATVDEGFAFIGIELDEGYAELALARIAHAEEGTNGT